MEYWSETIKEKGDIEDDFSGLFCDRDKDRLAIVREVN